MLEVILDTETTGLSTTEKHSIVEIGCVEMNDQIATKNIFASLSTTFFHGIFLILSEFYTVK